MKMAYTYTLAFCLCCPALAVPAFGADAAGKATVGEKAAAYAAKAGEAARELGKNVSDAAEAMSETVAREARAALGKPAEPLPPQEPGFEGSVLTTGLAAPWDMIWGPDGFIWVTEREGSRITRIDPASGEKSVVGEVPGVHAGPQHEGVLGMALSPGLNKPGENGHVYVGHTYMDGAAEHARIVRFDYDGKKGVISNPTVILQGLPAGDDHNGGRLRFGPDGKLYYSIGEQGHNQGANACKPNMAQRLPTADELANGDFTSYAGKVLRLNADGTVPSDNPVLNGVRSHVYTYGHRNPQGLVFVGNTLFESEQGPSSDDEINVLVGGGNYGWPHVAGFKDDQGYAYANWSEWKQCDPAKFDANYPPSVVPVSKESSWQGDNFRAPAKTMYTVPAGYNFNDSRCSEMPYLCWPTLVPASVTWYPEDGAIPAWRNSLLVTSLKNGSLYVLPLNGDKKSVQGDVDKYFHSPNRFRCALVSPDGSDVYIATDVRGWALGDDRKPTNKMRNPGSILKFSYTPQK